MMTQQDKQALHDKVIETLKALSEDLNKAWQNGYGISFRFDTPPLWEEGKAPAGELRLADVGLFQITPKPSIAESKFELPGKIILAWSL